MIRLSALLLATALASAAANPAWNKPFPPHKVIGNVYYVGSSELASYLITSGEGHILINSSYEETVPVIRDAVEKLGFKFSDIKILLISHAHDDHCAGSALVKKLTGAKYMVMEPDVPVVEGGGQGDFVYNSRWAPAKVDRVLHDGDTVALGGTVLIAHLTAGHTKGCTTWTLKVPDSGKTYDVVIVGSPNVNDGFKLVNNPRYPRIADDYARSFRVQAYTAGFTHDIGAFSRIETGVGANVTSYAIPAAIQPYYGEHPVGVDVYLRFRLRPGK